MTEAEVESAVVRWCTERGLLCLKLAIDGDRGFPDRTIIAPGGAYCALELKRPKGGRYSPNQDRWRHTLTTQGVKVGRARTVPEALEFIRRALGLG